LGRLRNEQLGNATGIQNLVRNIGGGIGISVVSTMLERYAQAHQVFMTARLSPLQPEYRQRLRATQHIFESGFSPADALTHAQASLYRMLEQQASFWAFIELFFLIACLSGVCVVFVFLFRRVQSARPVVLH
jgi:DHA2 family multidrug resistance protein